MGIVSHKNYIPERGDLVWLEFNPQAGREQAGKRPALIISPASYNKIVGLALICPITSKIKGYPFEVVLSENTIKGAILADQIKSLDWRIRKVSFIANASAVLFTEVINKISVLINDDSLGHDEKTI